MRHTLRRVALVHALLIAAVLGTRVQPCQAQQANAFYRPPVRDGDHTFQRRVWSWKELQQKNIVMQKRDFSCGAAALATVIRYYWGDQVTEQQFLEILDTLITPEEAVDRVENGLTLTDLRRTAVKAGYQASIGRLSFKQLREAKVPLIVGITVGEYDHFVVYRGTDGTSVYMADPIRGNIRISIYTFLCQWQENAILVVAKPGEQIRETSPLTVRRSEICTGRLNRDVVRDQALTTPLLLP